MANDEFTAPTESERQENSNSDKEQEQEDSSSSEEEEEEEEEEKDSSSESSSSSSEDSDTDTDSEAEEEEKNGKMKETVDFDAEEDVLFYTRPDEDLPESENTAEKNIKRFTQALDSKYLRKRERHEERRVEYHEDLFDFPEDPEKWTEGDLKELWADAPYQMLKPGWDPNWADEEDWEVVREEIKAGRDPPIAPFYVPYRKPYPVIPDNHYDISTPQAVIEELDRIEEFMKWVSYIFPDGSSYEGTVWDDLAHGKGVWVAEQGLVRYEGEWLQNDMEGHGVIEVDIPDREPVPGSKLEAKMREEGKIISRDFMTPEDREWLEMDIEDSIRLAGENYEIPFYENEEWIKQFGEKPQKGRYRYAGQWKHGRMHGCGVYDVNEQTVYGRFYFGELLEDSTGCDENTSALHAGIAEVAAAKARMFVNKPDGMVREERGPYSDPQHPYFYEDEDVWMAPGFINQFFEVPDYWKTYVHEVDEEREMWLNSFYKAPLRIPMPAELEYWWSKDDSPEFVLVNKEPEPDPEDPTKLIYTEDPLILHTRTGRLINYIEDENHGVRLFWQPPLKEGDDVDPEKAQFLPLGFDDFYGREVNVKKETIWMRMILAMENACKPILDKLEKWSEEKKKESEMKLELIKKELELVEAELCLEEAVEDMDEELRRKEKEEEKKAKMGLIEKEDNSIMANQEEPKASEEQEEEEEEDDDVDESSFGSVTADQKPKHNGQNGNKPPDSPFSACSLSFASHNLISTVPSRLQQSFLSWKEGRLSSKTTPSLVKNPRTLSKPVNTVSFPFMLSHKGSLRAITPKNHKPRARKTHSNASTSNLHSLSQILLSASAHAKPRRNLNKPEASSANYDDIVSLHMPMYDLESYKETTSRESLFL